MTKVEGNYARINTKEFIWYTMYLKHEECKSRGEIITVGIAAVSPHICCLLSTEEDKNNAIYML